MIVVARAAVLGIVLLLAACAPSDGGENAASTVANGTGNVAPEVSAPIVENEVQPPAPVATSAAPPPAPRRPVANADDSYRAIGTEPFWNLTIRDGRAVLTRPDKPPLLVGDLIRTDDGRAVRYQGEGFTTTITPGPCSDGMSDAIWSDRVQIAFAEGVLKGCGGVREMPEGE